MYILSQFNCGLQSHIKYHIEVLYWMHSAENQDEDDTALQRNKKSCKQRTILRLIYKTLCQASNKQRENHSKVCSRLYLTQIYVAW